MDETDVITRLRALPGAAAGGEVLRDVLAAGTRRRRHRRIWTATVSVTAVAVLAAGVVVAVGQTRSSITPAGSRSACRAADLVITQLPTGQAPSAAATQSGYPIGLVTRRACDVPGPLRLQVRRTGGQWSPVPIGPVRPMTGIGMPGGTQPAAPTPLDPSISYVIYLSWEPVQTPCPGNTLRLSAHGLTLAVGSLPAWCGGPVGVSQTAVRDVTRSVPWLTASGVGTALSVTYRPQCRGVVPVVAEKRDSVVLALVTVDPVGLHGCLPIPIGTVHVTVTLQHPLGDRRLLHAQVGPWPALSAEQRLQLRSGAG